MISRVRGRVATFIKLIILAIGISVLSLLAQSAFAQRQYAISLFLVATIALVAYTYLRPKFTPLKFMTPGVILLIAFVVSPIVYTVAMSTYNYKTGNIISKDEAIQRIEALGVSPDTNGTAFDISLGSYNGKIAILASDSTNNIYFISTEGKRIPLSRGEITFNGDGVPQSAPGFIKSSNEVSAINQATGRRFYYDGNFFVQIENLTTGTVVKQSILYNAKDDTFRDLNTNVVYRDNHRGNYANPDNPDQILEPGWRSPIWFKNFQTLFTDKQVRDPLFSVTIWTFAFAFITVLTQFAFGLLLAIALNKKIYGRRIYRSILILPYAIPSIMSILVWAGMFDTEFGAVNALFHTHIAWFQNASFARFAVILVNLWLGFPYFYLVSTGALQAIPSELSEAAAIDGANPRQAFRKVTLPLLLQILTPLLISSFAFNFNNFNLIYLLTGGGPRDTLGGQIAGATDILISYTYQIAFGSNIQNLGLASAISLIVFIIVASVSLYGIRRSKVMENFL